MTITKDVPITVDREIMSGAPVFTGTRVPVSALLENLEAGVSLDEFLENFPTVSREQVIEYLKNQDEVEFEEVMKIAERVMRENRELLAKLAKS
ncbi:MAG: DUF433 domain-containing protein [Chloracidobacterium sp.]|nr:DUF433 domain-containing protein [Chloracidobacterium sp.]